MLLMVRPAPRRRQSPLWCYPHARDHLWPSSIAFGLSGFLGCRRTGLDLAVAAGSLKRPEWTNAISDALRQRGAEHEPAYVESLRTLGSELSRLIRSSQLTLVSRRCSRPFAAEQRSSPSRA
jgi:hypothetical protein